MVQPLLMVRLPEDVLDHVEDVHYGQRDLCVFSRDGTLNCEKSSKNGVLKFASDNAVGSCPQRPAIRGPEVKSHAVEASALANSVAAACTIKDASAIDVKNEQLGPDIALNNEDFMSANDTSDETDDCVTPDGNMRARRSRVSHPALHGMGRCSN